MVWAQATAQIHGTVQDSSGSTVPGAEVKATQTATGVVRTTTSGATGGYVITNLPIGPYQLEVTKEGFTSSVQSGIELQVNGDPAIAVTLKVGAVSERVTVEANAALVETRSVGVGQVIENARILELPLNGRQVTDLITLAGAAVQTTVGISDLSMPGSASIAVAGGFTSGTLYVLDGALHNDLYDNLNLPLPFPDALQEFKVETSALSAQYGMYSGGTVTSVTKSGTNAFHGDVFEFLRNDLFNARNYFAVTNSTLKRNQFGGTVGGPIKKDKLFFFGGYQRTTLRQDPANNIGFVPTAAMLTGDFTAFAAPNCNAGRQLTLVGAGFSNNKISPGLFSSAALKLAAKLPQTTSPCGRIIYGIRTVQNQGQYVGRVDYQVSAKQSVFGRYLATSFNQPVPFTLDPNLLNTKSMGYDDLAQSIALGDTYVIGPNTVNSLRLAVDRTAINRLTAKFFSGPELGINMYSSEPHEMSLSVPGDFALGGTIGPNMTSSYVAGEDVSLVRGKHQISLGANLAYWRHNIVADAFSLGNWTFGGQATGSPMADFLLGKPSQLRQAANNSSRTSEWYLGLYAADAWKVTPRFTLSYGLRWEPGFPVTVRDGQIATFSEARYAAGLKTTVFNNAPFGISYPGDSGFPGVSCRSSGVCNANDTFTNWRQFAPRLGFAWDPKGDGRTSIRASYSLAYDIRTASFYQTYINPPWVSNIILLSPPGGFDNPWQGFPGGNPFPSPPVNANSTFPAFSSYFVVPSHSPTTSRNLWNLSIQRQLGTDWLVSVSYMGSEATHMWMSGELNQALYVSGNCSAGQYGLTAPGPCSSTGNANFRRRLIQTYPNVGGTAMAFLDQYEPVGTASYNGLIASVQRRASRGVTVGANYTWSHCISDFSASQTGLAGNPGVTFLDPNNRAFDRGNCVWDLRHVFNMTVVAETPRFANSTMRILATGWKASAIFRATTGNYLTITSGSDRQFSGVANQRALQILQNPYGDGSLGDYLNPKAFTNPDPGSLGNMRPLNVEGPGNWDLDMALSRVFHIRESQNVEVRAEAFNLTNSLRPGNPTTIWNNSTFGQITTALDPRILEFALKFVF
jgi:Carboxypeptidase regulatory-like domain